MIDLTGDQQVFDGLREVVLERSGSGQTLAVGQALRQAVSFSEAEASAGVYRQGDVKWELPHLHGMLAPAPGDILREVDGTPWTVLAASLEALQTRWKCWCRNLVLAENLADRVTIQRAVWTHDSEGAAQPTWIDERTDIPARIQPLSARAVDTERAGGWEVTHRIYLGQQISLCGDHRVAHEGTRYYVRRVEDTERLDRLQVVLAREG